MIVTLRTERIRTLGQVRAFLEGNPVADFELTDLTSAYAFVRRYLQNRLLPSPDHPPHRPAPPDRPHIRDPSQQASHQCLPAPLHAPRRRPAGRGRRGLRPALSGPATKVVLWRMYEHYGDVRFTRLAHISNGHLWMPPVMQGFFLRRGRDGLGDPARARLAPVEHDGHVILRRGAGRRAGRRAPEILNTDREPIRVLRLRQPLPAGRSAALDGLGRRRL